MELKKGAFIQCFWSLSGVLVVTEGRNDLVEKKTDCGVIGVFIKEFYRNELVK